MHQKPEQASEAGSAALMDIMTGERGSTKRQKRLKKRKRDSDRARVQKRVNLRFKAGLTELIWGVFSTWY